MLDKSETLLQMPLKPMPYNHPLNIKDNMSLALYILLLYRKETLINWLVLYYTMKISPMLYIGAVVVVIVW
jgi:hypothetical protein